MGTQNDLTKSEKVQAFLAILLGVATGRIILANNGLALLNNFGWATVNNRQAFVLFAVFFLASWS